MRSSFEQVLEGMSQTKPATPCVGTCRIDRVFHSGQD
jgi:hypothetical protein